LPVKASKKLIDGVLGWNKRLEKGLEGGILYVNAGNHGEYSYFQS
jgi:hypothetical protein